VRHEDEGGKMWGEEGGFQDVEERGEGFGREVVKGSGFF